MNTKIKLYCIILSVIYAGIIISHLASSAEIFMKGVELGHDSAEKNSSLYIYHFKVTPENRRYSFPEKMNNSLTGEEMNVEVGEYKIMMNELPEGADSTKEKILLIVKYLLSFVFVATIIYLPFVFFRIIKGTTKNNIIEIKVIQNISKMGWLLVAMFAIETLISVMDVSSIRNLVKIEGYNIVMDYSNYMLLILGVVTLLLAEVLRVSLKLKEDQDLTI